jgi:hypothetical protein
MTTMQGFLKHAATHGITTSVDQAIEIYGIPTDQPLPVSRSKGRSGARPVSKARRQPPPPPSLTADPVLDYHVSVPIIETFTLPLPEVVPEPGLRLKKADGSEVRWVWV